MTHPHWDHIIGLTYLLVPMILGQLERVAIYANRHTHAAIRTHLFSEPTFSHMPDFEFHNLEDYDAGVNINGCRVSWKPLPSHPGGSTAYRLDTSSTSFAYVTDTFVDHSYNDLITEVKMLIHECYFDDNMQEWAEKTGHSYVSQVTKLACEVRPGQLLLTHMDPRIAEQEPFDLDSVKQKFENTSFAHDLQEIVL